MSLAPRDLEEVLLERGGTACGDGTGVRAACPGLCPKPTGPPKQTGPPCGRSLGKGELDWDMNLRCPLGRPEEATGMEVLMAAHRAQGGDC